MSALPRDYTQLERITFSQTYIGNYTVEPAMKTVETRLNLASLQAKSFACGNRRVAMI